MNITKRHLPSFCYSKYNRPIEGIVTHYISLINADPDKWSDPSRIWEFLYDLNLEKHGRRFDPWKAPLKPERYHASYDILIHRDGTKWELAPDGRKVWHAGRSFFKGKTDCNSWMRGIALIAAPQMYDTQMDDLHPDVLVRMAIEYGFTDAQYQAYAEFCAFDMKEHGYNLDMVTGHDIVAPERKVDPGPTWDFQRLAALIKQIQKRR